LRQGKAREGQQADRIIRLLDMIEFPLLAFHLANSELQKLHLEHVGGQWAQVAWARNTECTSAHGEQSRGDDAREMDAGRNKLTFARLLQSEAFFGRPLFGHE
jgi:hypothetical protein